MQDRVSQYPGRVKLTPVSGQENVYDMEWADGATVAGTALNKANLLTDSTATAFGLTSSATVNTTLAKARELISKAQNTANGVTSRIWPVIGSYTGDGTNTRTISVTGNPQVLLLMRYMSVGGYTSPVSVFFRGQPQGAFFNSDVSTGSATGSVHAAFLPSVEFNASNIVIDTSTNPEYVNRTHYTYKYIVLCTN